MNLIRITRKKNVYWEGEDLKNIVTAGKVTGKEAEERQGRIIMDNRLKKMAE